MRLSREQTRSENMYIGRGNVSRRVPVREREGEKLKRKREKKIFIEL